MKTKLEKLFGKKWNVMGDTDTGFELEDWSPKGEDIIITLRGSTLDELAHDAFEAYMAFDPDEHASRVYLGKHGNEDERHFYAEAPDSMSDILRDARAIQRMYKSVADKLAKAARKEAA